MEFVNSLQVFPIPAFDNVNFSVALNETMKTQMRVIDAHVKVISSQIFNWKNIDIQIDLANIPSGVYYIEFGTESARLLEEFVVVR